MPKLSSGALALCCFGMLASASPVLAQSRDAPAGSALAATPPIDQRAKQFKALPRDQKRYYLRQGYKRHTRPY